MKGSVLACKGAAATHRGLLLLLLLRLLLQLLLRLLLQLLLRLLLQLLCLHVPR
jgi:hypothetical protein